MKKMYFGLAVIVGCSVNTLLAQTAWQIAGNSNITANNYLGTATKQPVIFRTNNTERIRILSNGKVGIGTKTPAAKLDVAGTILGLDSYFGKTYPLSAGTSGASYSSVGYGLTFSDTTAHYRYRINGDYSSMLEFRSGGFVFNTAPVGTAGTVIPYTPVMTIHQNGNVGIGTTDATAYKLKISHGSRGLDIEDAETGTNWELYISGFYGSLQLLYNGSFVGSFLTNGQYSAVSDERLKTNIRPMAPTLDKINQLKPSTYQFKYATNKQDYNGFIAQEVMKIFPNLVTHTVQSERNLDVYTLDYSGFGVVAIKGIQELQPIIQKQQQQIEDQQKQIEKQQQEIEYLQKQMEELKATIVTSQFSAVVSSASLQQNAPNPFNHTTTINYNLPQQYGSAKIFVTDKSGKTLKELNLSAKGKGSVNVDASTLPSGAYEYSLYLDGKLIDTKQMVLAK